jgi:hypothetical protein
LIPEITDVRNKSSFVPKIGGSATPSATLPLTSASEGYFDEAQQCFLRLSGNVTAQDLELAMRLATHGKLEKIVPRQAV